MRIDPVVPETKEEPIESKDERRRPSKYDALGWNFGEAEGGCTEMGVAGSETWWSRGGVVGRVRESMEFRSVARIRRAGNVILPVAGLVLGPGKAEKVWCCRAGSTKSISEESFEQIISHTDCDRLHHSLRLLLERVQRRVGIHGRRRHDPRRNILVPSQRVASSGWESCDWTTREGSGCGRGRGSWRCAVEEGEVEVGMMDECGTGGQCRSRGKGPVAERRLCWCSSR